MVLQNGQPVQRPIPAETAIALSSASFVDSDLDPSFLSQEPNTSRFGEPQYDRNALTPWVSLFRTCVARRALPHFLKDENRTAKGTMRFISNILACQQHVTLDDLKAYLKNNKRITIEQAAALIVSLLGPELGSELVPHLQFMILRSCMWLTQADKSTGETIQDQVYQRLMGKINVILGRYDIPPVPLHDHQQLFDVLQRCRRKSNKNVTTSLRIPEWLCQLVHADNQDESVSGASDNGRISRPQRPADATAVAIGRHQFNVMERLLFRHNGRQDQASVLRRSIEKLWEESVLGGAAEPLQKCEDQISLCFSFIGLQRRIQRSVVSDAAWTSFLAKGEGQKVTQNAPALFSSFELKLAQLAISRPVSDIDTVALAAVAVPPGLERLTSGKLAYALWGIDQTCLLMERYVRVHGYGSLEYLTYKRGARSEGDPRGPVDQYNKLVDILATFKSLYNQAKQVEIATEEWTLPGQCHKFLAKDIMHWNNAWKDDAFADGKVPGWVHWLDSRRKAGQIKQLKQ